MPNTESIPPLLRLLDLAEDRNSLGRLIEKIEVARKKAPGWKTGDAMLALVLCRAGQYDLARGLVPKAIDSLREKVRRNRAGREGDGLCDSGLELEKHEATRDLAFTAYDACLTDPHALLQFRNISASHWLPVRRYVAVALQLDRRDEARRTLLGLVASNGPIRPILKTSSRFCG